MTGTEFAARPLTAEELVQLAQSLLKPSALIELAVIAACLTAAWLAVRGLRGAAPQPSSVWFGRRVVDGLLFPVLALLFALAARWALRSQIPIAVFRLVVPILFSLVVLRLTVRVLRRAFPTSVVVRRLERSVSWLAWIGVVLWITGVLPLLLQQMGDVQWKLGSTEVSLRNIVEGVTTATVVLMVALWVSSALEQRLLAGATDNLSTRKMAANALRALLLFVGLMFALESAGIDLTALGVLGGAVGVGLGFGLQKLASNYISGFVILAERSMRIGDTVKVDNFEGRITDITTRYTVIRSLSGREAIVPNEMMITQRVENLSLADPRVLLTSIVQVAYGTDLQALLPQLAAAVAKVPRVLADPAPAVLLSNFAADGLELTIAYWISDPDNGSLSVRSGINLMVLETLDAAGVEIPFPQRVLRQLPVAPAASAPASPSAGTVSPPAA